MDIHHVGQLLDADFAESVAFYRNLGLDLRATTDGPVRAAFFETDAADAGLSSVGDPPEDGLGPYRRAFVEPTGHAGIPFEFVEPL